MYRNSTGWVPQGHQLDWPLQSPPLYSIAASSMPDCMHQPHLSSHWFFCQSTCLPVALSLSNKDFIVCIVVYGCPRENEYYVGLCTLPGRLCVPDCLLATKALKSPVGTGNLLLCVLLQSPKHTCPIFQIAVPQPSSSPCFPNIIIPFIWLTNPSVAPLQWQMQGCRFYWLCWSPHFISTSIPLTCQHPSCCWGTKPTWWIAPLPHRMSTFHFAFLIHLYTPSTDLERRLQIKKDHFPVSSLLLMSLFLSHLLSLFFCW